MKKFFLIFDFFLFIQSLDIEITRTKQKLKSNSANVLKCTFIIHNIMFFFLMLFCFKDEEQLIGTDLFFVFGKEFKKELDI